MPTESRKLLKEYTGKYIHGLYKVSALPVEVDEKNTYL